MAAQALFPDIASLHERHYGVSPGISDALAESARVCLDRHHAPPADVNVVSGSNDERTYVLSWAVATPRHRHALANPDDATRDGAYCLALAGAEAQLRWAACARTGRRTGADYYLKPAGQSCVVDGDLDLEGAYRLEISGIDRCSSAAELESRVRQKVEQARRGASDLPALAGVVAFNLLRIVFRAVE